MGVPALARCVLGPSARIDWATWSFFSSRIVAGPEREREDQRRHGRHRRAEGDVAEDVERREPAGERIEQPVQHVSLCLGSPASRATASTAGRGRCPRDALNRTTSPAARRRREQRRRFLGRVGARSRRLRAARPRPPPRRSSARSRPTQTSRSARPAASRPVSRCSCSSSGPSSSMSPRTAIRRAAGIGRQRLESRPHRGGIRVVGCRRRGARPKRGGATPRGAPPAGALRRRLGADPTASTPTAKAIAAAARKFGDLVRPGQRQADRPPRPTASSSRKRVPAASGDDVPRRDLGRGASVPKRTTRPGPARRDRRDPGIVGVRDEGPVRAAGPPGSRPSPRRSRRPTEKTRRCAGATRRIAATSGSNARESRERSPGAESPISPDHPLRAGAAGSRPTSRTRSGCSGCPASSRPRSRRARIAAVKSLVVVLPAEPVIAASRNPICALHRRRELLERLAPGPSTRTAGKSAGRSAGRRSPRSAARAPRRRLPARRRGRRRARPGSRRRDRPAGPGASPRPRR